MSARRRTDFAALAAAAQTDEGRPAPGVTAMRSKPMRTTIDLDPDLRGRLNQWRTQAAAELERQDVSLVEVTRALYELLLTDESVATAVKQAIKQ